MTAAELAADILLLGPDHREVILELVAKAKAGRDKYGPLNLDGDPRDFRDEAIRELLDFGNYMGMECVRLRRRIRELESRPA